MKNYEIMSLQTTNINFHFAVCWNSVERVKQIYSFCWASVKALSLSFRFRLSKVQWPRCNTRKLYILLSHKINTIFVSTREKYEQIKCAKQKKESLSFALLFMWIVSNTLAEVSWTTLHTYMFDRQMTASAKWNKNINEKKEQNERKEKTAKEIFLNLSFAR